LDVARIDSGHLQLNRSVIPVGTIIRRAVSAVQALADENEIDIESQITDLEIEADGDRIVQVLVNFLSNAIKFSSPGSKVFISVEQTVDQIIMRVTDNGRGIPESHLESIFDRFQQVEDSDRTDKGGTGLGLPICKSIIEQHDGTIGVVSEIGKGSTFWFSLPITKVRSRTLS
ncbi:MAG: sensor histidine kinase, partial [Terriglobales bacterium]